MQDFFIQNLQSVGLYTESLQQLLEVLSKDCHMLIFLSRDAIFDA